MSLSNTGIMNKAQEAVDETNREELQTMATLGWAEAYLNGARTVEELKEGVVAALEGNGLDASEYGIIVTTNGVEDIGKGWVQNATIVTKGDVTLAIGDPVSYTYDAADAYVVSKDYSGWDTDQTITQREGLAWRILGANSNGQLEIISLGLSPETLSLKNAVGYNNGVYILHDICKSHYSNSALGAVGRSIIIEDIEKQYSDEAIAAKYSYIQSESGVKYGATKTYGAKRNSYPVIYAQEALSGVNGSIREGGISVSEPFYKNSSELTSAYGTSTGNLVATQTYYFMENIPSTYFKNVKFYDMAFAGAYWFATREVVCGPTSIGFGLRRASVSNKTLGALATFSSSAGVAEGKSHKVRPVVTLAQDVVVSLGTSNIWELSRPTK